jgi:hypothetical protein
MQSVKQVHLESLDLTLDAQSSKELSVGEVCFGSQGYINVQNVQESELELAKGLK